MGLILAAWLVLPTLVIGWVFWIHRKEDVAWQDD